MLNFTVGPVMVKSIEVVLNVKYNRENKNAKIVTAGYDIKDNCERLMEVYGKK